jgi:hypothetical protein
MDEYIYSELFYQAEAIAFSYNQRSEYAPHISYSYIFLQQTIGFLNDVKL